MSDHPSRPTSRWSTSMSVTTKSTASTNKTIPLMTVRRKLFRQQQVNSPKSLPQRMAKSKRDIEELFKLYYANDVKFDTLQRQIVTGTRIPATEKSPALQPNLTSGSTDMFNSKHCVSREQINTTRSDPTGRKTIDHDVPTKRSVQIRVDNNSIYNLPVPLSHPSRSPSAAPSAVLNLSKTSPSLQSDELCDSSIVESIPLFGEVSHKTHEITNAKKPPGPKTTQRPLSSKSSVSNALPDPPPPSLLTMSSNQRKDPTLLSHTSFSTMNSSQTQQTHPSSVTGSAVIVRQRSPTKSWSPRQRPKSSITTMTHPSSTKTCSPTVYSPLSIQPDMPEVPVFVGGQRIVSIPSRCSRYVLVTFPEVPLRYNAPSYVERLLLPERFPALFQNIVHSYDPHIRSVSHHSSTK